MGALRSRVLVADDSDLFLRVAASVISATSTLRLVGAVGSGQEAIRLLPQLRPDLVLLDFGTPGMDGVQTTQIIRRDEPRTVVIVISAEPEGLSDVARAAGAATTLHKRDFVPSTLDALWLEHMPDGRLVERRMIALRQANQVRGLRAKLKQDLREGTVRLEQILATGADYLASAEVFDLLVAVPKIGPVKAATSSPSQASARARPSARSPGGSAPALSSCSAASSGLAEIVPVRRVEPVPEHVSSVPGTDGNAEPTPTSERGHRPSEVVTVR